MLTKLFQRCFVNVETTSINICWLNFHFQSNFNIETMLVHRHWIDVILSTLFQCCFVNVETTLINVRRLNFHFQPNINVETTLMNVDDQRCLNVDSTLISLLGNRFNPLIVCNTHLESMIHLRRNQLVDLHKQKLKTVPESNFK